MALHRNIKKSLLFTAYFVNGNLTSVRCNLTGKFVKRNIYFAIEKETTTEYGSITCGSITCGSITCGSITDFNVVSLSDDYINVLNVLFLALFSVLSVSLINLFL